MRIFGLYIGSASEIEMSIRVASLDAVRAAQRLAAPRGLEKSGEYGRGRSDAERDIRQLGDELRSELHRPIL